MSTCVADAGASRLRLPESGRFSSSRTSGVGSEVPASQAARRNSTSMISGCCSPAAAEYGDGGMTPPNRAGHIRVAVRVRPLPWGETGIIEVAGEGAIAIRKEAATGGNQFLATQQGRIEERTFDRVFGPNARQEDVYAWTCEPLIDEAVSEGRNATVFVYGATGAGKTHTMFGAEGEDQQGIIFRAVDHVFEKIHSQRSTSGDDCAESGCKDVDAEGWLEVQVSFLELYNEVVRDLLQDGGGSNCRVLEDERRGVVQVSNLVEVPVRSAEEALSLLRAGMEARTVEATAANQRSSRAHAVFSLTIHRVRRAPQRRGMFKNRNAEARFLHSKISLIDLAGSERAKDTQNAGSALKDGARINQSLLALANCIDALTAKGNRESSATAASLRKKPPYRDSKLTLMLKGSLTGDGLVAMVANVHPGRSHFEDSNNTLEYAVRASVVKPRRRARASLPAGSSPFQMEITQSLSQGTRVRRSATGEQLCDEEPLCMASSSTLPPPSAAATERRARHHIERIEKKLAANRQSLGGKPSVQDARSKPPPVAWPSKQDSPDMAVADSESTASSPRDVFPRDDLNFREEPLLTSEEPFLTTGTGTPEECLSELSLPDEEPDVAVDSDERAGAGSGNEDDYCTMETCSDELKLEMPAEDTTEVPVFVAQLIQSLQAEKVDLDMRLRAITLERNSLLQDRAELEQENERLRIANFEKDRQLAMLLVAGASVPATPATPITQDVFSFAVKH